MICSPRPEKSGVSKYTRTFGHPVVLFNFPDDLSSIGANLLIDVLKDLDRYREQKDIQQDDGVTYGITYLSPDIYSIA